MQTDPTAPALIPATSVFVRPRALGTGTLASVVAAWHDSLSACLAERDVASLTASMTMGTALLSGLRTYHGTLRAHSLDRPWILAESAILAASLISLDRERQLRCDLEGWSWLATLDRFAPVLLPVSTGMVGRRLSASRGLCLFEVESGPMTAHDALDIRCADDLVAQAPDRAALSHLLLVLPLIVPFTPSLGKLFTRAVTGLEQHPVRGTRLPVQTVKNKPRHTSPEGLRFVNRNQRRASLFFDGKLAKAYYRNMSHEEIHKNKTGPSLQRIVITEGVHLAPGHGAAPASGVPAGQAPAEWSPTRPIAPGAPPMITPEPQSPFSTKKIMQIFMGKLPTPEGCD